MFLELSSGYTSESTGRECFLSAVRRLVSAEGASSAQEIFKIEYSETPFSAFLDQGNSFLGNAGAH